MKLRVLRLAICRDIPTTCSSSLNLASLFEIVGKSVLINQLSIDFINVCPDPAKLYGIQRISALIR